MIFRTDLCGDKVPSSTAVLLPLNTPKSETKSTQGNPPMKHRPLYFEYLLLSGLFFTIPSTFSQTSADPELLAAIQKIKAIDNHSHVLPARKPEPAESERPDPLGRTPFGYPVRLCVTNPEYIDAWRALYGYKHHDMAAEHV